MRKRIFTVIAICALSIFAACSSNNKEGSKTEFKNLTAYDKPGYSISVTNNWTKTENDNASLAFLYKSSENDFFTENITAIVQDLDTYDYTLDTYKELSVSQYEELGYKIDECKKVDINDNECYSITSYSENEGKKIYCRQVFTLRNKKAYLFTFAAEEKDFKKLSEEVNTIFDTIAFNDEVSSEDIPKSNPDVSDSDAPTDEGAVSEGNVSTDEGAAPTETDSIETPSDGQPS